MKKSIILALVFLSIATITNAQKTTILEARNMAAGTVVTVKGIVTHGSEWGPIRYFQDNTAGIAAYAVPGSPSLNALNAVNKGDSVTITGSLKLYGGLLELDPITSVVVNSTGNPVPDPLVITPAQVGETTEGRLVEVKNAVFAISGVFAAGKTYAISANGESVNIFINKLQTDIIGQPIPQGLVNLTAISSQYYNAYNSPPPGYQLLPRNFADIHQTSSIFLTSAVVNTNITKTELDFSWTTNVSGSTEMFYGLSAFDIKSNLASSTAAASHGIALSGLPSGQIIYTQAFSVNGTDTAFSGIMPFATASNSSGAMKVYFNTPVDNSYSTGTDAIYLYQAVDDTLINYINRAKYSIDLAIYNFNNSGISNISNALKAAANRGVTIRVVGCGTTANLGVDELAGSLVHILIGPTSSNRNGIMHNKFFLFDTESADANDPLVWTGSTNLTSQQINLDANNVIIIQDQSLARAYKIEFEEMWGSSTTTPNAAKALFGSTKKNNTPHEFSINGKRVECYFSPSDGINTQIVQHINTANRDLDIATMVITRTEIAAAIAARKTAGAGVNMLTDASGTNDATVNSTLLASLGASNYVFYGNSGIMHNKYLIIDQGAPESDPMVLTGSHNWSSAADNDNDENTLIVHDATIANLYYQNFVKLYAASNGVLLTGLNKNEITGSNRMLVYPNPVQSGNVKVSCFSPSVVNGTIQLIDVTGKVVFEKVVKLNNGENIMNYSMPGSYKGLYFLKLTTAKSIWNQKVLFE
jgi:phosphatidylserine/phosphatidylglycerophosphate/cardiolipin synthase-like enzyme